MATTRTEFQMLLVQHLKALRGQGITRKRWMERHGISEGSLNNAQTGSWIPDAQAAEQWALALGLGSGESARFVGAAAQAKAGKQASDPRRTGALSAQIAQLTQERDARDAQIRGLSDQLADLTVLYAEVLAELGRVSPAAAARISGSRKHVGSDASDLTKR